ncbi:MAG: hypothetical protein AB7Q97_11765 [Gammaproteobacteria bacterium]
MRLKAYRPGALAARGVSRSTHSASAARIIVFVFALLAAATGWADDVDIDTPRLTVNDDGTWQYDSAGTMSGAELGRLIENAIGKGNYQQTTVMLNTCHSGAGTQTVGAELAGPHNVISTCGPGQTTAVERDRANGKIFGFLPALLDSVIADPKKSVDEHFDNGKAAEPRLPKTPEQEAAEKARYERYRQSLVEENTRRGAQNKPPLQVPPAWDEGGRDERIQEPQSGQSADKPGTKPLAAGAKSNHAVIYRTDDRESAKKEAEKAREAFAKAGFTSVVELTPPTAADNATIGKASGGPAPAIRGDMATPGNLQKTLEALRPSMNPEAHLAVVVLAHGALSTRSNNTQGNAGAGNGARHSMANPFDHIGSHATANLLAEEALIGSGFIVDDYLFSRWAQPALVIQTAEEFSPGQQPVQVALNGIFVGDMRLGPDGYGHIGYHRLDLTDDMIAAIVDGTDITDGLELSFGFASPADFFTLATQEDLAANGGALRYAGTRLLFNLSGSPGMPVSAPGSLALSVLAGVLFMRDRQGARP